MRTWILPSALKKLKRQAEREGRTIMRQLSWVIDAYDRTDAENVLP